MLLPWSACVCKAKQQGGLLSGLHGSYLDRNEDDDHPLQPQAVFLTQVASHQVC